MIEALEKINSYIGRAIAWLALTMVVMMTANVAIRYIFASGAPWQQELVRFMHAGLFMLGAGYALQQQAHVRVDVLYHRFSSKGRAIVDILGVLLLLFPFCFALIYFSHDYVTASWAILEGSGEYNGMPGIFLLKSCIWGCGSLVFLQGIVKLARSIQILQGHTP